MNNVIKKIIRVISFLLILTFLLLTASYMLAPKDNTKNSGINNPNANGFFSEPKNSIDIAVIGNSDAYSGFSPMELWNQYGYTSYVSAEGRQSVSRSYVQLKHILTCQKPQVVILETDGFFAKSKISKAIINLLNSSLGSTFSIFQYHNRWKMAKMNEYFKKPEYTAHCASKGQKLCNDVKGYLGGEYMVKTDEVHPIPATTIATLDSFVSLCNQNNIKLIFVELPSQSSWSYPKHNAVQKYADKKNIEFMDLNIDRSRFKLNWKKDSRDGGNHLNNRGARKATLFIGEYINNICDIRDKRSDKEYEIWNKDYDEYLKQVNI